MLKGGPVNMAVDQAPRFQIGDSVQVLNINPEGHTRLPRYARGKQGVVDDHHGAHVYPDSHAHGVREGQHLYSVSFSAAELWGQDDKNDFRVSIDMWEPYLDSV
jgi:nitrile hydratase